jgi:tetratricopeptide (TPR) repeat protein
MPVLLSVLLSLSSPGGVDWRKDYDAAREEARRQGRLILLHFTLEGRPICKTMDEETFAMEEVVKALSDRFIAVRADSEKQSTLFESTVGGRGGLSSCVVDAEGDVVSSRNGYAGPQEFLRFLEKARSGYGRIQAARRALSEAPGSPERLYSLGEAYRDCDSLRRAEECYRRALDGAGLGGGDDWKGPAARGHERLARLCVMRGKNLEARQHLEAARKLDPEGRNAPQDRLLLTEGLTLAVERRHAEAAAILREAIRLHPGGAELDHMLYALGFVLHQGGQDKPALEPLESVVARFPGSAWVAPAREQIEHIRNPQPDHTH